MSVDDLRLMRLAGRTVSQDPVLWRPADGGGDAAGRFGGQPQAGETFDAGDGDRSQSTKNPIPVSDHPAHKVYPYLLRGLVIDRANQVWCADITYVPMAKGFVYLVAVMDWFSRRVSVVAGVDHDGFGFLRGSAARGPGAARAARDF